MKTQSQNTCSKGIQSKAVSVDQSTQTDVTGDLPTRAERCVKCELVTLEDQELDFSDDEDAEHLLPGNHTDDPDYEQPVMYMHDIDVNGTGS